MALILVIDDDVLVGQVAGRALQHGGHDVVTACGGKEGIDLFQQQPFDLVITDVRMPGLSGPEVIKALHALRPGTRVIVMGGDGSVPAFGTQAFARQVGADRVLLKPFGAQELNDVVAELLAVSGGG